MKRSITALAATTMPCGAMQFAERMVVLASFMTRYGLPAGAPRFYPDAVTIAGVEAAPAQMEAIAALVGSARQREWFVKDSFQSLDLDSLGFEPVFDAEWVA